MSWLKRRPKPAEIDEELRFHLEEKQRRLIADGLPPAAARREARKAFGSQAAARECTPSRRVRWARARCQRAQRGCAARFRVKDSNLACPLQRRVSYRIDELGMDLVRALGVEPNPDG